MKILKHELSVNQIGMVLTNFLISFLAVAYVVQSLNFFGARFQALMPSLVNVLFESSEKLCTSNISFVMDLIDLTSDIDLAA